MRNSLPNPFPGNAVLPIGANSNSSPRKFKKAGTNGTLIAVIIDESGSMSGQTDATIAGFNEFVLGQKSAKDVGAAYLTLVKFDAPLVKTVYESLPITEVPNLNRETYSPGGVTYLMDAIGETLESIDKTLHARKKKERPAVIVLIMTDGEENQSRKFNKDMIKELVGKAEAAEWTFMFMGANIDSFTAGAAFGMRANNTVNYDIHNTTATYEAMAASSVKMRSQKMGGLSNSAIYAEDLVGEATRKKLVE